ncbi:MAG: hypothetical protein U0599_14475 [Vicinamibacteria bacterium]
MIRPSLPRPALALLVLAAAASAPAAAPAASGGAPAPADVSFLLRAPAGGDGFVRVRGGHLATDAGRLRLWGVNLTGAAALPAKEDAPRLATRLAGHGLNAARLHFLDLDAPRGLLAPGPDSRALDPAMLDRLDFFVVELAKRGVYTDLNLNVGRRYRAGDGVREHELLGFGKAATHFDERLVLLQRDYARALLAHRNPYTGREYRHEPAVALVELVNENSVVESWFSGRLLGEKAAKDAGTWTDVPASYARDLTARYQSWLRERLSPEELARVRAEAGAGPDGEVARLRPEELARSSELRFRTEARFYVDLETRFFTGTASFLKDELGVRMPVLGTADHNHYWSGYPLLLSTSRLDVVDGHDYWQHPDYLEGRTPDGHGRFRVPNTAMVDDPLHSTVVELSRSAVAGKPYTVSEVNHPFPAEHAAEGIPVLAAYAALQDWDGIFWYTLEHAAPAEWKPAVTGHFDLRPDPVKMAQLTAGSLAFLRADVAPARVALERSYTETQALESLRLPHEERPYFTPGFDLTLPLRHRVRIRGLDGGATDAAGDAPAGAIVSDTGELSWRRGAKGAGLVTVDAPRAQAIVGFSPAGGVRLTHLAAEIETPFAALTLGPLDDRPIARASRLLLVAGGRVANTGQQWSAERTGLEAWGGAPVVAEPVRGTVTLRGLEGAKAVEVQPLDEEGRPRGRPASAARAGRDWSFRIGDTDAVWYAVRVER